MRTYFYMTVVIFSLSSQLAHCSIEDDFVDPLDMVNYDRVTKSMKKPKFKTDIDDSESVQNDRCTVFLTRFVNMLLLNTGISKLNSNDGNNKKLKSFASVTLSSRDLQILETMVRSKNIDYMEIDRILNGMFAPVKQSHFGFQESNSFVDTYQVKEALHWTLIASTVIVLLYLIFRYIQHVFSIAFIVFVGFAFAFGSTWYTMYTKAEINRSVHLEHMPSHCYNKEGTWFSWFGATNLDECKKYKEAIHLNPKYSIALTEVLAEMMSKMMMKPIETLGESIYVFNKSALKDFPLWAQLIMVPIIIIIIIKTMLLACALLVGRSLSMKSIFGYGSSTIGSESSNYNREPVANNGTNQRSHFITSAQHAVTQLPKIPNVNLNINLFHPTQSLVQNKSREDSAFSFGYNSKIKCSRDSDLISMLKNKDIDSVDSNNFDNSITKRPRHRTMSF